MVAGSELMSASMALENKVGVLQKAIPFSTDIAIYINQYMPIYTYQYISDDNLDNLAPHLKKPYRSVEVKRPCDLCSDSSPVD